MVKPQSVEIERDDLLERETHSHPAFGMIGFSRVFTGGNNVLFGSSIKHNDIIQLCIKHGEQDRILNGDYYHGRGNIVIVEMSYSQFSECISSLNIGDGVPCTITFTEKDGYIPPIKDNFSKREQFRNEFSEIIHNAMSKVQKQISKIQDSIDVKKPLGVKERKEIVTQLQGVKHDIGSHLDFCVKRFDEQMDKSTSEAKGEIECFYQNKINNFLEAAVNEKKNELVDLKNPVNF